MAGTEWRTASSRLFLEYFFDMEDTASSFSLRWELCLHCLPHNLHVLRQVRTWLAVAPPDKHTASKWPQTSTSGKDVATAGGLPASVCSLTKILKPLCRDNPAIFLVVDLFELFNDDLKAVYISRETIKQTCAILWELSSSWLFWLWTPPDDAVEQAVAT